MTKTQASGPPTQEQAHWQDAEELRWAARHWAVGIGVTHDLRNEVVES